jgi:hypothetical protein
MNTGPERISSGRRTRRRLLPSWWRFVWWWRRNRQLVLLAALVAGLLAFKFAASPWPMHMTVRHWLAAPNCASARAVGLAPARDGQPGYYFSHDADHDGIACEPYRSGAKSRRAHGARFVRP